MVAGPAGAGHPSVSAAAVGGGAHGHRAAVAVAVDVPAEHPDLPHSHLIAPRPRGGQADGVPAARPGGVVDAIDDGVDAEACLGGAKRVGGAGGGVGDLNPAAPAVVRVAADAVEPHPDVGVGEGEMVTGQQRPGSAVGADEEVGALVGHQPIQVHDGHSR
jgi:hypothetical protein